MKTKYKLHILIALCILSLGTAAQATNQPALAQAAQTEQAAQNFVQWCTQETMQFLSQKNTTPDQKIAAFRELLTGHFDVKTMARFSLGRYWKTATDAQKTEYIALFENMIVHIYAGRFESYQGQVLQVGTARVDGARDFIVNSSMPNNNSVVNIDWRVRYQADGTYRVVDVIVAGVSMALTQRSDFASVIQRGGGKVDALLNHLRNAHK